MKNGSTAQDRRRARRAAERAGISEDDLAAIQELALVASAPDADVEILPTSGDPLPEELALARIEEAFQHGTRCGCGHALDEHNGAAGACAHADGRGTCSCASFSEATTDESAQSEALEAETVTTLPSIGSSAVRAHVEKTLRAIWAEEYDTIDEEAFVQRFMLEFVEIAPPADGGVETAHGPVAWTAIFVPEATLTDDGRAFAPGALEWRDLPLSLMAMTKTSAAGGHDGAEVSGRIDQIWREGNLIMAGGVFDEGEFGGEISRMVADGTLRGLSVDIAIHEAERGPKSDYFDESGNWITERPETAEEEPSIEDLLFGDDADLILVVTKGVIGMATVCPFPAFAEANISLAASAANPLVWTYARPLAIVDLRELPSAIVATAEAELATMPACANCDHAYADHGADGCEVDGCDCSEYDGPDAEPDDDPDDLSLTAAAAGLAPLRPPVEWFQNPDLDELTPMTIDEDGRIYGHAWGWGTCHTGVSGTCTTAPRSNTNYAYFHVGEIECEDGELVSVGRITFDTGHADRRLSRQPTLAHYDHTGKIGAFVVVGEDAYGGWIAGTLAAEISEEDVQRFRGSAPSGDWRSVNGNLELIALLSVNVPGFPVPRPRALVAAADDGLHVLSLTAAGVAEVLRERTSEDDFREIEALVDFARGDYDELLREARG